MRSLVLLSEYSQKLNAQPICVAHNAIENQLVVASVNHGTIYVDQCSASVPRLSSDHQPSSSVKLLATLPLPSNPSPTTTNLKAWLTYLSDSDALCLALSTGDIFHVFNDGTVENMGEVDSGIEALAWSHDESVLALVNGAGQLVLLTHHFHPLIEFLLDTKELGEDVQVALGWGKKETQFHGSLGKNAAKLPPSIQTGLPTSDPHLPYISWRGDDQYFVVSSVDFTHQRRVLRIFSKEGILQSTSEPVSLLEHTLAWKPSGALIAASQLQPHQHIIAFFEKNGLRHGEFVLPFALKNATMVHLAWNLDGSALLVWMRTTLMDVLQIWTCSNYHWQLQQCMELASICHVQWDALIPLRLYVFTITKCFKYQFSFQILQSYQSKNASVCVIDTFHLRHTPFLHVNMPPPLSSSEISCELPLKAISFCQELENSEDLALITGWNTNEIILCHPSDETSRQIEIQSKYILSKSSNISLRQPLYLTKKLIVFLAYLIEEEVDALVTVELDTTSALSLSTPYLLSFYGYLLAPIPINEEECTEFCLQDTTGQVWKVQLGDDCTFGLRPWLQLPESQVDTMSVDSMGNLISLSGKARLYFNETMLCSNCLSYTLHSTHLFYTTLQHQLVCHRLHHSSTRSVELGAKLVVSNSTSVVLQMPRGNLETIYPRVLLMEALIHEFQAQHWLASFELCRRHRLDLNTLVDLNPVYFLENLTEFVTQLGQPTHLNLFLSHLKNEDTLRHQDLPSSFQLGRDKVSSFFGTKINTVCDHVRRVLHKRQDPSFWISSYLTTFVKKQPPELVEALKCLYPYPLVEQENALSYLIFLVNVDTLLEVALGMYDLDMYLLVAQASHQDPRDYLSLIETLNGFSETYRRFYIDRLLRRHKNAFDHLLQLHATHWDELVDYMKLHGFYQQAIHGLTGFRPQQQLLFKMYAHHLEGLGKYKEAGQCFVQAQEDLLAMGMFERAGAWKEALTLAKKLKIPKDEFDDLVDTLMEYLKDRANWLDMGHIYHLYLNDIKKAVQVWTNGGFWIDAIRILYSYDTPDLLESLVVPALQSEISSTFSSFTAFTKDVRGRVDRLIELHQEKATQLSLLENVHQDEDNAIESGFMDNVDVVSEAGSMKTTFTGQTFMTGFQSNTGSLRSGKTGKSRRKQERKRHLGKKGSPFEEAYLYDSIRKLVLRCDDLAAGVKEIIEALFLMPSSSFDTICLAQELKLGYDTVLKELQLDLNRMMEDTLNLPSSLKSSSSSLLDTTHFLNERADSAIFKEGTNVDRSVPKLPDSLTIGHILLS